MRRIIKNLIERIFTKKNIKIFVLVFVVIWFFVWSTFADSPDVEDTILKNFTNILRILVSILSRWWILLASLAWKLMTNELVYGTFLNMDQALWNLWNIVKNFANFILWFILLFSIVKNIFMVVKSDSTPLKNAIDTVKKILIAWVLVQMSRFLVWMALDFSTIATAVVWSIPSQIIANDSSNLQKNLNWLIESKQVKLEVDFTKSDIVQSSHTWELTKDEIKQFVDTITPSANSVIWPLIFLWGSVFDLFESSDTSHIEEGALSWRDLFLTLWVNWFVIIIFTIMMAFIFLFNLFRVITLWIVIPLSPFIILMQVFDWKGDKLKIDKDAFLWQVLSVKNVLNLIFKPVYMVLVLSIVLIVMTIVKWLVKNNNGNFTWSSFWNVTIASTKIWWNENPDDYSYNSSMDVDWFLKLTLNGTKNTIVDLMVYILWLALMFMLMKSCIASKTWIKFIDNIMGNVSKSLWWEPGKIWWLLWSVGVVPIWEDGKRIGLSSMNSFKDRVLSNENNAWAHLAGIDLAKQDEAVERIMWWSSFNNLSNASSKKDWIESAIAIWKSKWYTTCSMMESDQKFEAARQAWNKKFENDGSKRIDISEVRNSWKTWKFEVAGEPAKKQTNWSGTWWGGQGNQQQ